MTGRATLRDVARMAGVHPGTVSRALNPRQTRLAARGIDCPGEVSMVGFDDMPFADRGAPPLTTIRIQYEIGLAAADLLLERL